MSIAICDVEPIAIADAPVVATARLYATIIAHSSSFYKNPASALSYHYCRNICKYMIELYVGAKSADQSPYPEAILHIR